MSFRAQKLSFTSLIIVDWNTEQQLGGVALGLIKYVSLKQSERGALSFSVFANITSDL